MRSAPTRAFSAFFALAILAALALPRSAASQVSCADPDNLCTGDPCTISDTIEVQSPCVVDFSPRALIIMRALTVPSGGTLSFTAGAIEVRRRIVGRHTGGTGADVTLAASGDVTILGDIDVGGTAATGTLTIDAGGNVALNGPLSSSAVGHGAAASGGTITVEADGTIISVEHADVEARGVDTMSGGQIALRGAAGVTLGGGIDAKGGDGGTIEVSSSAGAVTINNEIHAAADAPAGTGGSVVLAAQGTVTLDDAIKLDGPTGGSIDISSDAGDVTINSTGRARGLSTVGGTITVNAPGTVLVDDKLDARGKTDGGSVTVSGAAITIESNVDARGRNGNGGTINVSTAGALQLNRGDVRVDGRMNGGTIGLSGGTVVSSDRHDIIADGDHGISGSVSFNAAGNASLAGDVSARGDLGGGTLDVSAATVQVGPGARIELEALALGNGGEMRCEASAGDMLLDGRVRAIGPSGGVIEGQAPAGNLTAVGEFSAAVGGCIGLSASGTLDVSAATFDVPLSASCP